MPTRLLACPSCARHIRVDEERCPFCGVALADDFGVGPTPVPPARRMSREELYRYGRSGVARTASAALVASAVAAFYGCAQAYGHPPSCTAEDGAAGEQEPDGSCGVFGSGGPTCCGYTDELLPSTPPGNYACSDASSYYVYCIYPDQPLSLASINCMQPPPNYTPLGEGGVCGDSGQE